MTLTVIDFDPDSGSGLSLILIECPKIRENLTTLAISLQSVAGQSNLESAMAAADGSRTVVKDEDDENDVTRKT